MAQVLDFDGLIVNPLLQVLEKGVTDLSTGILVVASIFAVLDFFFSMIGKLTGENIQEMLTTLIQKLIKYSFCFFLITNFKEKIVNMAYDVFSKIGNSFGNGFGNGDISVNSLWNSMGSSLFKLLDTAFKFNGVWLFVYIAFFIIGLLFCLFIIVALITAIINFHIVANLSVMFLAVLPFDALSDIGRKTFNAIIGAGVTLMVAVALSSIGMKILNDSVKFPENFNADNNEPGLLIAWLCLLGVIAFLIKNYENIASMIMSGQGGIGGGAALGAFVGVAVAVAGKVTAVATAGAGAVVGQATGAAIAKSQALKEIASNPKLKNMTEKQKKAYIDKKVKAGASAGRKIGSAPGKVVGNVAKVGSKAIKIASGDFSSITNKINEKIDS